MSRSMSSRVTIPPSKAFVDASLAAAASLDSEERLAVDAIFNELLRLSKFKNALDRDVFLGSYQVPGLVGERLVDLFSENPDATDENGARVSRENFTAVNALLGRGTWNQRCDVLFNILDVNRCQTIDRECFVATMNSVPEFEHYLSGWDEIGVCRESARMGRRASMRDVGDEPSALDDLDQDEMHSVIVANELEVDLQGSPHGLDVQLGIGMEQELKRNSVEAMADRIFQRFGAGEHVSDVITKTEFVTFVQANEGILYLIERPFSSRGWALLHRPDMMRLRRSAGEPCVRCKTWMDALEVQSGKTLLGLVTQAGVNFDLDQLCAACAAEQKLFQAAKSAGFGIKWPSWDLLYRRFHDLGFVAVKSSFAPQLRCFGCRSLLLYCQSCHQPKHLVLRWNQDRNSPDVQCLECKSLHSSCWHCDKDFSQAMLPKFTTSGFIWIPGKLGVLNKFFAVLEGQQILIYRAKGSEQLEDVVSLLWAYGRPIADKSKQQKGTDVIEPERFLTRITSKFGFAVYRNVGVESRQEFFCETEAQRKMWLYFIRKVTGQGASLVSKYDLKKSLGKGKFGAVRLGQVRETGGVVAVKQICKDELTLEDLGLITTEIRINSVLQHKNIVQLHDVFDQRHSTDIVMEFLAGGELMARLLDVGALGELEVRNAVEGLLSALKYLEEMGICHRDIKLENVLLTKTGTIESPDQVKLSDFGLSWICGLKTMTQPCGTLPYAAPEVLGRKPYTQKADIWSLGISMHVLMFGRLPYDKKECARLKRKYNFDTADNWPGTQESRDFLLLTLTQNPAQRPWASELVRHPWFGVKSSLLGGRSLDKGEIFAARKHALGQSVLFKDDVSST